MIPLLNVHVLKPDIEAGITPEHIVGLAESYGQNGHRAPIVLGHPQDNHPAWGWVNKCRAEGDNLYCDLDVTPELKQLMDEGRFRERSVAFYNSEPPTLRHIGFLGAVPPRIKGLEPVNLSDSIEPYMTQETQLTQAAPEAPDNTASFIRPVALFALSEVLPGIKASDLSTEPTLSDGAIAGQVNLSDGKAYSYSIAKAGEEWKATTTLLNPEVVTLSEQVADLRSQLARNNAASKVEAIYSQHKLTPAIFPKESCLELIALSEGTKVGQHLQTLLSNLPSMVAANPITATPEARIDGFNGFQLSETAQYQQVVAKATELGLNPNNPVEFTKAFNAL